MNNASLVLWTPTSVARAAFFCFRAWSAVCQATTTAADNEADVSYFAVKYFSSLCPLFCVLRWPSSVLFLHRSFSVMKGTEKEARGSEASRQWRVVCPGLAFVPPVQWFAANWALIKSSALAGVVSGAQLISARHHANLALTGTVSPKLTAASFLCRHCLHPKCLLLLTAVAGSVGRVARLQVNLWINNFEC